MPFVRRWLNALFWRPEKSELRGMKTKYCSWIEQVADPIDIIQDGQRVYQNPARARLLGYRPEENVVSNFLDEVAPEDRERVMDYASRRLRGEEVSELYVIRLVARDGRHIPVEVRSTVIDCNGRPAIFAIQRDISKRLQVEAQLRESEAQYRSLLDGSIQGIFIHVGGIIQFANPALARIFGYDQAEDLIGQDGSILIAPEEKERMEGYRQARLRGEPAPSHYEYRGIKRDGTRIWMQLAAWGMEVSCVADGPAALTTLEQAHAEARPYQLVLLDYHMPEMDGLELARRIKANPCLTQLPLVMISSVGIREAQEAATLEDMTYMSKPVRQSQLYTCLIRVVAALDAATTTAKPVVSPTALTEPIDAQVLLAEDNVINQKVAVRMTLFTCDSQDDWPIESMM